MAGQKISSAASLLISKQQAPEDHFPVLCVARRLLIEIQKETQKRSVHFLFIYLLLQLPEFDTVDKTAFVAII